MNLPSGARNTVHGRFLAAGPPLRRAAAAPQSAVRADRGRCRSAIGIGANTTIFTIANALLFKTPAGVVEPGRLVDVGRSQDGSGFDNGSYPNYLDIRARNTVFTGIYAYSIGAEPMSLGGARRRRAHLRRHGVDELLQRARHAARTSAACSRLRTAISPARRRSRCSSHQFWLRRFNGDPAVVGQTLQLNGRPFTVIGVAPDGFHGTTVLTSRHVGAGRRWWASCRRGARRRS